MNYSSNLTQLPEFEAKPVNGMIPQMKLSLALNQRKVFLYDDVNEDSVFEMMYYFHKIMEIDKCLQEKPPIDFYISSNGGSAEEGFSLISLIEYMKDAGYVINTINIGKSYSMGFALSICGTNRYCYRYSRYMIHDVSSFVGGKLKTMEEDIEESKKFRLMYSNFVKKYTNISDDTLKLMVENKKDIFYNAEEALSLGIVDKII